MPRKRRPSSAVPAALRERLSPEARRELADLDADLDRFGREVERGDVCPPFLEAADREAPGAGALWLNLDAGGPVPPADVGRVAARLGMDGPALAAALGALRRAEAVADAPGGLLALPPGNVPF